MNDDLKYLNMDSLQEMYAYKYYKVYKTFPRYSKLLSSKDGLVWHIKLLTMKEKQHDAQVMY